MNINNVLSIRQYAEKKGISVQAVYQAIKRGSLPTIEIGGKPFIHYGQETTKVDGRSVRNDADRGKPTEGN